MLSGQGSPKGPSSYTAILPLGKSGGWLSREVHQGSKELGRSTGFGIEGWPGAYCPRFSSLYSVSPRAEGRGLDNG